MCSRPPCFCFDVASPHSIAVLQLFHYIPDLLPCNALGVNIPEPTVGLRIYNTSITSPGVLYIFEVLLLYSLYTGCYHYIHLLEIKS